MKNFSSPESEIKFCSFCGGKLHIKKGKGKSHLICQRCQKVHYRNPVPAVDAIIETKEGILLIKRKNPPQGWALPGGFVDYGETLEEAVKREIKEECNLRVESLEQFHTYSDPKRDPRFHTISTVFIVKTKGNLKSGDDAEDVKIFSPQSIPNLVFDHGKILEDYFRYKKSKKVKNNE